MERELPKLGKGWNPASCDLAVKEATNYKGQTFSKLENEKEGAVAVHSFCRGRCAKINV